MSDTECRWGRTSESADRNGSFCVSRSWRRRSGGGCGRSRLDRRRRGWFNLFASEKCVTARARLSTKALTREAVLDGVVVEIGIRVKIRKTMGNMMRIDGESIA